MSGYPVNYEMSVFVLEPYKKQWIKRVVNLGRCLSKNEAIEKSFSQLLTLGSEEWKNLIVTNEHNKVIYRCSGSPKRA